MSEVEPAVERRSEEEIANWLVAEFALVAGVDESEIDVELPFSDYALDSSIAVSVANKLSAWVNKELPITVFWEYPNIRLLSSAISIV